MKTFRIWKQLTATAGLLVLCGMPAAVFAQDASQDNTQSQDQAMPMKHGQKHEDEFAKLNLTDDQKAQVDKIRGDARAQMNAVKQDTTLTADQQRAKMQQIHKASHKQVMAVLTPDQRQQMKADAQARKAAKQAAPPPAAQ